MTKEEYLSIGKKHLDYSKFNDCFYIPGKGRWFNGAYRVAEFKANGYARIYCNCILDDECDIITSVSCIEVNEPSEFEDAIKKFQKSYKEALVEQKMCAIDKDFE